MHMKLRDIYVTCKRSYAIICDGINEKPFNISSVNEGTRLLSDIEFLQGHVNQLLRLLPKRGKDYLLQEAEAALQQLLSEIRVIINLCESLGLDNEEIIGLDVKLPVNNSLTDLKGYISDLEFVFTRCPYFKSEEESIEFRSIDIGSVWLNFVVVGGVLGAGSIILNNIAAFIDKCIILRSHYLTTLQQKNELEKAKMENDERKAIFESLDKMYKIMVDNAINELEKACDCKSKDGEERGIVEQSVYKIIKLMNEGLQIYSAIDSPKEVKALFEPLEMKYLTLNNELKLIEKDNNQEEDKKD